MSHQAIFDRRRAGYSLIEMIIVLAISGLMMAALLQSMLGIRQYASTAEVQDDLNLEAQRILAIMREDLGASGWYLPTGQPDLTTLNDRASIYFPYVQVQQAGKLGTRFPHHTRLGAAEDWVTITHYPGLPGSTTDWDATSLDPARYRTSFYARSQELIFLKVMMGTFNPNSAQPIFDPIDFGDNNGATYATPERHADLGIRTMAQWDRGTTWDVLKGRWYLPNGSRKIYDADASGLWLRLAASSADELRMPLRWETMTRYPNMVTTTTGSTTATNIDLRDIREYSYAVVPNRGSANRGQLVRAYKKPGRPLTDSGGNVTPMYTANDWVISSADYQPDATLAAFPSAMVVDRVLSDKVDRITFDTFRTDRMPNPNFPASSTQQFISGLEINQVRVRLFLSKRSSVDMGAAQRLMVEATLSMRSTSDTNAINDLATQLGTGGTVIIH